MGISLPDDFVANYDRQIKDFWFAVFSDLPNGATILDVCTGNGAIALLAAKYSQSYQRDFSIQAVDLARLDIPALIAEHPHLGCYIEQIKFQGGIKVEDMALGENSVDLITSQYGVEYCDWPKLAANLARILKPTGCLAFLTHSTDTDILAQMRKEQRDYEHLSKLSFEYRIQQIEQDTNYTEILNILVNDLATELSSVANLQNRPILAGLAGFAHHFKRQRPEYITSQLPTIISYLKNIIFGQRRMEDMLSMQNRILAQPDWYKNFVTPPSQLISSEKIMYQNLNDAGTTYYIAPP